VRIESKPIILKLEINLDFPAKLIGDELRVRQILNKTGFDSISKFAIYAVSEGLIVPEIPV